MASYIAQRGRKLSVMERLKGIPGEMIKEYKGIGKAVGKAVGGVTAGIRGRDAQMRKDYLRVQRPDVQAEAQRQIEKKEAIKKAIKNKKGK